eukprot:766355-Hanusia_phi.AAC.2
MPLSLEACKLANSASPCSSVVDIAAFFKRGMQGNSFKGALDCLAELSLDEANNDQGIFDLDTSLNKTVSPRRGERVHLESSFEGNGEVRYVRGERWAGSRGEYNRWTAMSATE